MTRRVIAIGLLAGLAVMPSTSSAATVIAETSGPTLITAGEGRAIFSRYDAARDRWQLMLRDARGERVLPAPSRSVPFDADLGTDSAGRPAVVYSRCRREPGLAVIPGGADRLLNFDGVRGCDVYRLRLDGTPERRLAYASTSKEETRPSLRAGTALVTRPGARSDALVLATPRGRRALGAPFPGTVTSADLGARDIVLTRTVGAASEVLVIDRARGVRQPT